MTRSSNLPHLILYIQRTSKVLILAFFAGIAMAGNYCLANEGGQKQFLTSSVGDLVWSDYDRDGRQDVGERGVPNVEIVLYDANNQVVRTVRSDASGYYSFTGLNTDPAGKVYKIHFKLPPGYLHSPRITGFTDTENSDADEATGMTNLFTLAPGQVNNDIDAGLIGPNGTLPLHRLELNTVLLSNYVLITWEAENELNTTVFVVQRSFNGVNFSDIASKTPAGPVNTPTTYQVTDHMIGLTNPGCLYYRVKAMDSDGRLAYSKITMIKFSSNKTSTYVWPIPFVDRVNLTYHASVSTRLLVTVTNSSGKIIRQLNLDINPGANQILFNGLDPLSSGIYFVRIYDQNTNEIYTRKISK
jgi:hypothetical protein